MMMGSLSSMGDGGGLQLRAVNFYSSATASASHSITLPEHDEGDMLICCAGIDDGYTLSASAGWTKLSSSCSLQSCQHVFYKLAGAGESLVLTPSSARLLGCVTFAVRNADTLSGAFHASAGTANIISPPTHTAAAGAAKYLWLTVYTGESSDTTSSGAPSANISGYSDWDYLATTVSHGFFAGECHRMTTSNTEDPNGSTSITIGGTALYPVSSTLAVFKAP